MTKRGDVVLVDFPFTSGSHSKIRPALVIQNDVSNRRLSKTIVALITGNLRAASAPTHFLIDPAMAEHASSGLHGKSLVACTNLYTVEQASVIRTIGHLSGAVLLRIDSCLRAALGI
ncbi:MAG TPA: type II toxin-antitoxin system PemK/MazF family toxin [Pirellulales bacterium]|nr:type II toxin-antitoxin system PemK/MazF family toxin [Pirellulales bacterium]